MSSPEKQPILAAGFTMLQDCLDARFEGQSPDIGGKSFRKSLK